jgi:hypothetical protein
MFLKQKFVFPSFVCLSFLSFSCQSRKFSSTKAIDEDSKVSDAEAFRTFRPAMLVRMSAKGPMPVCSAIPVQMGSTSDRFLLTTRGCVEKDKSFLDSNKPGLQVVYSANGQNILPVEVESYLMRGEQPVKWVTEEKKKEDDSNVATEPPPEPEEKKEEKQDENPTFKKFAYTPLQCSDWVALVRVRALPEGFRPTFLPIADLDDQSLEPLRSGPEANSKEKDGIKHQNLIWRGPVKTPVPGKGIEYGDAVVRVLKVTPDSSAFTFEPLEAQDLKGFEIGTPVMGGFRGENPASGTFKSPTLYGIFLGRPKFKGELNPKTAFANLATCAKSIRSAIFENGAAVLEKNFENPSEKK